MREYEIIKALRMCAAAAANCIECPYCDKGCSTELKEDAAALLESLVMHMAEPEEKATEEDHAPTMARVPAADLAELNNRLHYVYGMLSAYREMLHGKGGAGDDE